MALTLVLHRCTALGVVAPRMSRRHASTVIPAPASTHAGSVSGSLLDSWTDNDDSDDAEWELLNPLRGVMAEHWMHEASPSSDMDSSVLGSVWATTLPGCGSHTVPCSQVTATGTYTLHGPARVTKLGPTLLRAELLPGAWLDFGGSLDMSDDGTVAPHTDNHSSSSGSSVDDCACATTEPVPHQASCLLVGENLEVHGEYKVAHPSHFSPYNHEDEELHRGGAWENGERHALAESGRDYVVVAPALVHPIVSYGAANEFPERREDHCGAGVHDTATPVAGPGAERATASDGVGGVGSGLLLAHGHVLLRVHALPESLCLELPPGSQMSHPLNVCPDMWRA